MTTILRRQIFHRRYKNTFYIQLRRVLCITISIHCFTIIIILPTHVCKVQRIPALQYNRAASASQDDFISLINNRLWMADFQKKLIKSTGSRKTLWELMKKSHTFLIENIIVVIIFTVYFYLNGFTIQRWVKYSCEKSYEHSIMRYVKSVSEGGEESRPHGPPLKICHCHL